MEFKDGYEPMNLVKRAMRNAHPRICGDCERWVAVMDTFGTGSTMARELCKHFDLDPDEKVSGPRCLSCDYELTD